MHDCWQRHVRYYPYLGENVAAVYGVLRKRASIGGDGTVSTWQLARDLYPDVGEDKEAQKRKSTSVRRWIRLLERQGAIRTSVLTSPTGKSLGLRVELCAMSEVGALTGGCSSAGSRARIPRVRLRGEELDAARVRRWCPRAGRGAPRRFVDPSPFFSPPRVVRPGGVGGSSPTGTPPSSFKTEVRRARGPDWSDARSPDVDQNAVAAPERPRTAALTEGGTGSTARDDLLSYAEELGEEGMAEAGLFQLREIIRELREGEVDRE